MTAERERIGMWLTTLPVGLMLICLATACVWTVLIGWADALARQQTTPATERAIGIQPDNASYPAQLARLLAAEPQIVTDDPDTLPGSGTSSSLPPTHDEVSRTLRQAVFLNPHDARSWMDLGLRAESNGDYTRARNYLLRAAVADRGFLPRWTLASYNFRRDDVDGFWLWAKEAIATIHDDALPFFRLCGRVTEDGNLIDRLQIGNPDVRAAYLYYLLGLNRVDLAGPAVQRVLENSRVADVPVLLTACERLVVARRVDAASDLWNRLAQSGALSVGEPRRTSEQLLVNGRFTTPPTSRGFDWELQKADGISASREEGGQGIRVTFSGNEPEVVEVLGQAVPVRGGTPYELQATYRTNGVAANSGLIWYVVDVGGAILAAGPVVASDVSMSQRLQFRTPPVCRLIRVSLVYRRAPGTTRLEGYVSVPQVKLFATDQTPGAGSRVR